MNHTELVLRHASEHEEVLKRTFETQADKVIEAGLAIANSIAAGGTLFIAGNGGSAADSQHIAAEFVGRFKKNRRALRALALTTDSSALTCIANDYSYDDVFARQLWAFAEKGDCFLAISTSGNSQNVRQALQTAHHLEVTTIGLLGKGGGTCAALSDISIIIPSDATARIQEMHILIGHLMCELVEEALGFA